MNNRSRIIAIAGIVVVGLIVAIVVITRITQDEVALNSLPNGVAAGDVTPTSVVLWTHSTKTGPVTFTYGTDETFEKNVGSATATVTDAMLPVKVQIDGLTPHTQYYYRAANAVGESAVGTFRTPAEIGTTTGLRFGVTGDWRGDLSPYPAVTNVRERDLDFMVLLGDTIYADVPSPDLALPQALSLADFRIKHNEGYGARYGLNVMADLRASTAVFVMIDDHEVTNDFAGSAPPDSDLRFMGYDGAFINQTELFSRGLLVFQEYNPLRDEFYGATGDPRTANQRKLYRYATFGSDAAIFLLDARSFRDEEVNPMGGMLNEVPLLSFLGSETGERTMLGQAQLADLKVDLLAAQAAGITWKFILVPEPAQNLGIANAGDRFEGYPAERAALLRFIDENKLTNVVFVAADFHGTLINDLAYQTRPLAEPTPIAAFEIVTGPVAYDKPFGPTIVNLALGWHMLTPEAVADYEAMSRVEKDRFVEHLVNAQMAPFNYSPIGLQDAELLDVELVRGSYLVGHTFGWTEFQIEAETQMLRVITYGIDSYSKQELDADPAAILARAPEVVSEFVVYPQH